MGRLNISIWLLLPDPNAFSALNHINKKKKKKKKKGPITKPSNKNIDEYGPQLLQKNDNHLSRGHFMEWNVKTQNSYVLTSAGV